MCVTATKVVCPIGMLVDAGPSYDKSRQINLSRRRVKPFTSNIGGAMPVTLPRNVPFHSPASDFTLFDRAGLLWSLARARFAFPSGP